MFDFPSAYSAPITLRIGGVPVDIIGYGSFSGLHLETKWTSAGGGLHALNFTLGLPVGYSHPALHNGATVEAFKGTWRVAGSAVISDIDFTTGAVTADGLYRMADHFAAIGTPDSLGRATTSSNPAAVVAAANLRGLGWNGVGNLPNQSLSAASEAESQLNTVADVLDAWCAQNGMRWGLDRTNTPYMQADPAAATLNLRPGTPALPTTADDYSSRVVVRYISSMAAPTSLGNWNASTNSPHLADGSGTPGNYFRVTTAGAVNLGSGTLTFALGDFIAYGTDGTWAKQSAVSDIDQTPVYSVVVASNNDPLALSAPLGVREEFEDLSSAGLLSQGAALAYAQQYATANAARTTYAASLAPTLGTLTDLGGNTVPPWRLIAGQRVRHFGVRDTANAVRFGKTDTWVIGGTTWEPASDTPLVLDPVDLAPRTVVQVQAATTDATQKRFT